jgi:hypothetical protein
VEICCRTESKRFSQSFCCGNCYAKADGQACKSLVLRA